jgi:hypothetical protein
MRRRFLVAMGLLLVVAAACSDQQPARDAVAAFERFQDALFTRDTAGLGRLVTGESSAAVAAMPWDRIAARQRLVPVEASDERGCFHVHVRDPNEDGARGTFVVVRENGRLVVDLVATAALHARATGPSRQHYEVEPMTPADHDRMRAQQLAMPPGRR